MNLQTHIQVQVSQLSPTSLPPKYATDGSAAFDFFLPEDHYYHITPGSMQMVGCGLAMAIPEGWCMLLFARSGHAAKNRVSLENGVGVIDSDYRGEIKGLIKNDGDSTMILNGGDRYMQGMLVPVNKASFVFLRPGDELPGTERGAGGFGSTGGVTKNSTGGLWDGPTTLKAGETPVVLSAGFEAPAPAFRTPRSTLRQTHTLAELDVPQEMYDYVHGRLKDAGYDHAISEEGLDMTGIMITRAEG